MVYSADDIRVISWPELIRIRPLMYYSSVGQSGCIDLINQILERLVEEKYQCGATQVELRLTRHNEIIIEYDGRGMPVDSVDQDEIPQPRIYRTLMSLCTGETTPKHFEKDGHLADIGALFNAACEALHLTTFWDEASYSVLFRQGCISTTLYKQAETSPINCLKFIFDKNVMGEFEITVTDLKDIVSIAQNKYPNSRILFRSLTNS